jgi:putative transposase
MPAGPRILMENACYHIITRGNQKQQIFLDDTDLKLCVSNLRRYKKKHDFLLYGFCLMPNHIHIIGEPKKPKNLSKFMHGFLRSYTAYFNKRYKKVGHLWQDRFKSKIIAKDRYLIDCINYVELNPVRAGLAKAAFDYHWSSHRERVFENSINGKLLDPLYI